MKKALILFILIISLCVTSACAGNEGEGAQTTEAFDEPVKFSAFYADWPWYSTTEELVDHATCIYEGTVTGISFGIVDRSGKLYTKGDDVDKSELELVTFYEVEVTKTHKGEHGEKHYVKVEGGYGGYDVATQVALLKDAGIYDEKFGIWTMNISKRPKVGDSWMFCVIHSNDFGYDYIVNNTQYIFRVDESTANVRPGEPTYASIKAYFDSLQ